MSQLGKIFIRISLILSGLVWFTFGFTILGSHIIYLNTLTPQEKLFVFLLTLIGMLLTFFTIKKKKPFYYQFFRTIFLSIIIGFFLCKILFSGDLILNNLSDVISVISSCYLFLFLPCYFLAILKRKWKSVKKNLFSPKKSFSKEANLLDYLKVIAKKVGVKNEKKISLLSIQYDSIKNVDQSSTLSCYLNKILLFNNTDEPKIQPYFPFGFNASQKSATKKALHNQISVIEGPPGTGKTQTILNIIANAIFLNKTVAVVSNNNSATDNVLEKLDKQDLSFIAAPLGNAENRENFFANQNHRYPNMNNWHLSSFHIKIIKFYLTVSGIFLDAMLLIQNKLAHAEQTLSNLLIEKQYYKQYYQTQKTDFSPFSPPFFIPSNRILKLWVAYQFQIDNGKPIHKNFLMKSLFLCATYSKDFFYEKPNLVITHLQHLYYVRKEKELSFYTKLYKLILKNFSFLKSAQAHEKRAMKLLKAGLRVRCLKMQRTVFFKDTFKNDFSKFIKEYPVILSSTHSLKNCIPNNFLFDYVIVDEASQVDLVTGALVLSCAKNIIIVGDTKQLPKVLSSDLSDEINDISEVFDVKNTAYDYVKHNLLSSMTELFPKIPKTLLREHYRCHPKIIEFCNQRFYNNNLIILSKSNAENPISLYITTAGHHARGHKNQRQIDVILNEIIPTLQTTTNKETLGVITPYREQADTLETFSHYNNLEIATVHKFQGREKDIIILSTVSNQVNEFISKPDLLNVAVSRAINKLIVVIAKDNSFFEGDSILSDLVRYIKYNNFEIIESELYSVFDLLYTEYSIKLRPLLKRLKNVSKFKSENIINTVIEDVLLLDKFCHLRHVLHVPLRILIRNTSLLGSAELDFVLHPQSHVDFIIFSKIDKHPVLAIEVDGYAFHESNPEQLLRDNKKDTILKKYGIPIIRFSTIESNEKERLIEKLKEVCS